MDVQLNPISPDDAEAVVALFNHYVRNGFAAFAEQPVPPVFFAKLMDSVAGRPAVAARDSDGRLLGFGLLRAHGPFATTAHVAEITYFVDPECTGQGIGSRMLQMLEEQAKGQGIRTILAPISSLNAGSLAFHARHGFAEVGRFRGACIKQGTAFDVVWMQKDI